MAAAIEGTKNLAPESVVRSKAHAAQLRMVRRILHDEGKGDVNIGQAMLTFYNGLACAGAAPEWGPAKYAWLLPAFFAAAAEFPEGFRALDDLIPLRIQKDKEVKRKQAEAASDKQSKQAAQQQEKEKDAEGVNRKRKASWVQASARPQQRWRKGINL
eukprot:2545995-Rhodomonas_salina.2